MRVITAKSLFIRNPRRIIENGEIGYPKVKPTLRTSNKSLPKSAHKDRLLVPRILLPSGIILDL